MPLKSPSPEIGCFRGFFRRCYDARTPAQGRARTGVVAHRSSGSRRHMKNNQEETMSSLRSNLRLVLLLVSVAALPAHAADIIVSAQDGKFVRVDGRATYP